MKQAVRILVVAAFVLLITGAGRTTNQTASPTYDRCSSDDVRQQQQREWQRQPLHLLQTQPLFCTGHIRFNYADATR
ncbi:MAG: hypothetical protein WCE82_11925 [Halobacteriota archaeon]